MTAFGAGFPGAPGAAPGAPTAGFVLSVQADPSWEPMQTTDTLEKDGYYCAQIVAEKLRADPGKKAGVFFSFRIVDDDAAGKVVSKFMPDPRGSTGDTWWLWRSLMRSIYGNTEAGKNAFQYVLGQFQNAYVYIRTGAYHDNDAVRTGVDALVTQAEWTEAKTAGGLRFRWDAKVKAGAAGAAPVGAIPTGLPASFPGSGGGLPGAPSAPVGGAGFPPSSVPAPAAAPMQQAAPMAFPSPVAAAPAPSAPSPMAFPSPVAAPPAAVGGSPFGFPPAPAPSGPVTTPQPAANGFPGFPGGPT